jgi:hypothetical protein
MDLNLRHRKEGEWTLAGRTEPKSRTFHDDHAYQDLFHPPPQTEDKDPAIPPHLQQLLNRPFREGEGKWRELYRILLENGYLLHPRYNPESTIKLDERPHGWGATFFVSPHRQLSAIVSLII